MIHLTKPLIYVCFEYTFKGKTIELKTPGSIINPENKNSRMEYFYGIQVLPLLV